MIENQEIKLENKNYYYITYLIIILYLLVIYLKMLSRFRLSLKTVVSRRARLSAS